MENYTEVLPLEVSAEKIFVALTEEVPLWWTALFEGFSESTGQEFTVRFGESVYKTIEVKDLRPYAKVEWNVRESRIAVPELKNQREWEGTSIVWKIEQMDQGSLLTMTHVGLHPGVECYAICSAA